MDAYAELEATTRPADAVRLLESEGVSRRCLLTPEGVCGALGLATIEPTGARFQFFEGGRDAVAIGLRGTDCELVDLLAWFPDAPARWWTRFGLAVFAGEEAVERAALFGKTLRLHETPLDWLRADCAGAVVLDPQADIRLDIENVAAIECASVAHGRAIARQLREAVKLRTPPIIVPEPSARAA
jgi:hypothetical protein